MGQQCHSYLLKHDNFSLFGEELMDSHHVDHSYQDFWGSPKIPTVKTLGDPDNQGWFPVNHSTETPPGYRCKCKCIYAGPDS